MCVFNWDSGACKAPESFFRGGFILDATLCYSQAILEATLRPLADCFKTIFFFCGRRGGPRSEALTGRVSDRLFRAAVFAGAVGAKAVRTPPVEMMSGEAASGDDRRSRCSFRSFGGGAFCPRILRNSAAGGGLFAFPPQFVVVWKRAVSIPFEGGAGVPGRQTKPRGRAERCGCLRFFVRKAAKTPCRFAGKCVHLLDR